MPSASERYGLVFEDSPEWFPLPGRTPRVGDTVVSADGALTTVGAGDDVSSATVVVRHDDDVETYFETVARVDGDPRPGAPTHQVIAGENYHALQRLLVEQGPGTVDVIYVDPPYNTGARHWIYNDAFGRGANTYKPSTWLSFMERRLRLARELLKPSGVIFVAISDAEHHRLRMLLDQVFGDANFGGNVVWQGSPSSLGKFTTGGLDYMLIYAKDRSKTTRFADPRPHAPQMLDVVARAQGTGATPEECQEHLRAYISEHRDDMTPGLRQYNRVDNRFRVYGDSGLVNSLYRPNLKYPVTDPATGKVFESPANGWKVKASVMDTLIADDLVLFGDRKNPVRKLPLVEYTCELPAPVFTQPRNRASAHLRNVLGDERFPFPKDHEVLMRWIRMAAPDDAVVLDFFGGSGSTAEAVIRLNNEDGGTRRCILVTNNEVGDTAAKKLTADGHAPGDPEWEEHGVFHHVTRPRLTTVVTGVRHDGSIYGDPLEADVSFEQLTYREPDCALFVDDLLELASSGV